MGAVLRHHLERIDIGVEDLDELMGIEQAAYSHPWSRGNFIDSISAGHLLWGLREPLSGELLAYCVLQRVLDEAHLLNITVARGHWGRGLASELLRSLHEHQRQSGARQMWLEVRVSNARAQALYEHLGYREVGQRKGYYPALQGQREDARVMRLDLEPAP